MNDEKKSTGQNDTKSDLSEAKTSQERITIRRGPGYVPGLLEPAEETHRKKPIYVGARKRRVPPWAVAIAVFVTLMLGLFLIVPKVVEQDRIHPTVVAPTVTGPTEPVEPSGQLTAVVKVSFAPLFASTELRAARVAELLLNEPVTMLDTSHRKMIKVRTSDGTVGFVSRDQLSADVESISASGAVMKLVIRTPFKRVMTHARSGSLLVEAPMGAILYADYRKGDLLRVKLPDDQVGWVNAAGLMLLEPHEEITPDQFHEQFELFFHSNSITRRFCHNLEHVATFIPNIKEVSVRSSRAIALILKAQASSAQDPPIFHRKGRIDLAPLR
jgi:hypothetical protein